VEHAAPNADPPTGLILGLAGAKRTERFFDGRQRGLHAEQLADVVFGQQQHHERPPGPGAGLVVAASRSHYSFTTPCRFSPLGARMGALALAVSARIVQY